MFLTKSVCTIYVRKVRSTMSRERTHVYGKGRENILAILVAYGVPSPPKINIAIRLLIWGSNI